ncbi:recombinase zinc beta ribbon domain-containing protein [Spongiactinospora sp. 9N601]|uniref:recombinase zinc beta ribbon domain-containing protein n=1 Tax=Spongiactinospora sp. 9N601 TaxID=3375149 RepID=UPI0037B425DB
MVSELSILHNARYTGYQVWNKQRSSEVLVDPGDVALGVHRVRRGNPERAWVWSRRPAHPAIVTTEDFDRAQTVPTIRGVSRTYVLRGLLRCGVCGRSMEGTWTNGRRNYRCRPRAGQRHRSVFVREDTVAGHLGALLIRAVAVSQGRGDVEGIDAPRGLAEQAALCRSLALMITYRPDIPALVSVVRGETIIVRV